MLKVDVCPRHQCPSNTYCCHVRQKNHCKITICSSCILEREPACLKYPVLREFSHLVCQDHLYARMKVVIESGNGTMPPIQYEHDELNPFAESLFPKFHGDIGGGGTQVSAQELPPCTNYDIIVNQEFVRNHLLELTNVDFAPPEIGGKTSSAISNYFIGLIVWKLIVCKGNDDEFVPWVKLSSFKEKDMVDQFDGIFAALLKAHADVIEKVKINMSFKGKDFYVRCGTLCTICQNLNRKYRVGVWSDSDDYSIEKLYFRHYNSLVGMGYLFGKKEV